VQAAAIKPLPGARAATACLAASQLRRLKSAGIRLTASVDEVAASGGFRIARLFLGKV